MLTFLSGKALYPLLFNKHIASIFLGISVPLHMVNPCRTFTFIEVTFLIANALAS